MQGKLHNKFDDSSNWWNIIAITFSENEKKSFINFIQIQLEQEIFVLKWIGCSKL